MKDANVTPACWTTLYLLLTTYYLLLTTYYLLLTTWEARNGKREELNHVISRDSMHEGGSYCRGVRGRVKQNMEYLWLYLSSILKHVLDYPDATFQIFWKTFLIYPAQHFRIYWNSDKVLWTISCSKRILLNTMRNISEICWNLSCEHPKCAENVFQSPGTNLPNMFFKAPDTFLGGFWKVCPTHDSIIPNQISYKFAEISRISVSMSHGFLDLVTYLSNLLEIFISLVEDLLQISWKIWSIYLQT